MIKQLTNNELIFLAYLYQILQFPKAVLLDCEALMQREFIGQHRNTFKEIPLELISIGCLLYCCKRHNFVLDEAQLNAFIEFLYPDHIDSVRIRIDNIAARARDRCENAEIAACESRFKNAKIQY